MRPPARGPAGGLHDMTRGGCLRAAFADVFRGQQAAELPLAVDHQQAVVAALLHDGPRRLDVLVGAAERDFRRHVVAHCGIGEVAIRSEEHTSELQSLMRSSYAVFCLKKT